jgi:preprotein translocase subunit SecG
MLRGFILAVHVLLAFMIVILVLLQRGKGAEAGAGFGSGASGTVFGARGTSTLFSRLTAAFAAAFFVTSLALAYVGTRVPSEPSTLLERRAQQSATAPQIPALPVPASAPTGQPAGAAPAAPPPPAPAAAPPVAPAKP